MNRYADVVVPLSLDGLFTYEVPHELSVRVEPGSRVVVPFGSRRSYTAIVVRVHDDAPAPGTALKAVADVLDEGPLLLPEQLALWRWLSTYYMCTPGEVMRAALPSGLKLESETQVSLSPEADPSASYTPRERALLALLSTERGTSLDVLSRQLGGAPLQGVVRRLLAQGAVRVHEALSGRYRPLTEQRLSLAPPYASPAALRQLYISLDRSPAQRALLDAYFRLVPAQAAEEGGVLPEVARAQLLAAGGGSTSALAQLRRKGVFAERSCTVDRLPAGRQASAAPSPLAPMQQRAFDAVVDALGRKEVCLLHGVTSSGKTEVYIHLISRELAAGRQVLYLVPEIALTTQLTERLGRIFGGRMGVYHSKFPDALRVELWQRQLSPSAFPLVLGVRSSLFLPFRRLGLVIVDEEHDASYKQQDPAPRYNARDAAIVLARQHGARVVLGTATPALETYHNALEGKYALVEMTERYGGVELPEICVEDVGELRRKRLMKTPFSPRLTAEVHRVLAAGGQAILFQNRRGYAPVVVCRSCGWSPRCPHCDVSLTLHSREGRLVCHYCGATFDVPRSCPQCGDTELRDVGYGTERIEEAVATVFPEARTLRMDLDTTRSRPAYERIIDDFQTGRANLLVGTQMVTKGLDFGRVGVVGILNADQMLCQPDFRAHERAFQMMSQVAGRAGRRGTRGLVVLQTRSPGLPLIGQVVRGDYAAFYRDQTAERRLFCYPPFCRLIYVSLRHRDERTAEAAAAWLAAALRPHFPDALLGPDRPPVGRARSLFIRRLVVKVGPALPLAGVRRTLLSARAALLALHAYRSVGISFDVDPA